MSSTRRDRRERERRQCTWRRRRQRENPRRSKSVEPQFVPLKFDFEERKDCFHWRRRTKGSMESGATVLE
ncbi:hypothetical protein LWI29_019807 [Acer saccharum]|uniref:Uncharacterized protein n=1 Tax=Acer saccharum TaxID=4024 RepID=A0AA39TBG2_ACESA|nr:hypothetical protein LWI29_019807 [Acer saccharum]KAK1554302.1 hypothetical protein Q3G72_010444 [Acer saccharum]KAK1570638.1 hypothetical protein Q3G72_004924 [Acer saccharum]